MPQHLLEVVDEEEAVDLPIRGSTEHASKPVKAPMICLDFQQVVVSGPSGKVDRKDAQKVRAHVMRQHHQKRRKVSGKDLEVLEIEKEDIREVATEPARKVVRRKVVTPRKKRVEFEEFVQYQPPIPAPRTRSPLGSGRWDPFLQIPTTNMPKGYHELVDHCITTFWPGSFGASNYLKFARDMIPKFAQNPLCLYSTMFASASHLEGLRASTRHNDAVSKKKARVEQLERIGVTLRAVDAAMRDETSNQSDDLILTILILASSETSEELKPADWSPFDAPLRSMQWIDIRGKKIYYKPHVEAFQLLIRKRGGLRNIKTFGVPCVISSLELTWCASTLSPPTHPLLDSLGRDIEYTPFKVENLSVPLTTGPDSDSTSGFSHLAELHLYPQLREVLLQLKDYSDAAQRHVNGEALPDNMIENRNWVFHNLLRIPAASTLPRQDYGVEDIRDKIELFYETCRVGAILYSIHVIYPTARSQSPRERLLPALKEVIGRMDILVLDRPSRELILWCLIIGGIAATGSQDKRNWFVKKLKVLCVGLTKWSEIKAALKQFPWVDSACDSGGEGLWNEVSC